MLTGSLSQAVVINSETNFRSFDVSPPLWFDHRLLCPERGRSPERRVVELVRKWQVPAIPPLILVPTKRLSVWLMVRMRLMILHSRTPTKHQARSGVGVSARLSKTPVNSDQAADLSHRLGTRTSVSIKLLAVMASVRA